MLDLKSDKLLFSGSSVSGGCLVAVADLIAINGNSNFGSTGCAVNPISVSISPSTAYLYSGQTQQFTATVTNSNNSAVTWSINPSSVGSISSSGLYTAPAAISTQQTVTVTATSQADTTKSSSATITLYPPMGISISPTTASLYASQTQQFTATVTNANNTAVTWSITPSSVGSISSSGLYTAPTTISTQQTVIVSATSQANGALAASAAITLYPPIAVSVSPTTSALYASQTQQFAATVTNTSNTAVTWSISPSGVGTISSSGTYTAPATVPTQQAVTVTATSQANAATSSSATITLYPPLAVSVSPTVSTLYANQTQQFTATVTNASNTTVIWTISPSGAGTISSSGLYAAPATIATQQTVTVTATSEANGSVAASATVTLYPPIMITVAPTTAALSSGQTQQFSATVTNSSNSAVTWSIGPSGVGSISGSGLYTAPATISTQQTVTVTATSKTDGTTSASATVSLTPACASSQFGYFRQILIDHTKVPNTDQANFPFLLNTTDPLLKSTSNGGHVANPNGYDIVFAADSAGQTTLNFEIEKYDPTTGQLIAWVRIPTLSHVSDTVLYVLYGNASITTSQQNPAAVWDTNYKGVWHVPNGTQLSLVDSTSNANNASDNGALAAAGEIDGGMQTNSSTFATIGTPASLANLAIGNATFSAWVNTALGSGGILMGKDDQDSQAGWTLGINQSNQVDFAVVHQNTDFDLFSSGTVGNSAWSYVVVTLTGTAGQSQATVYINGQPSGSGSGGVGPTTDDSGQIAYLANATYGDQESGPLNGTVDEFRISNTARSADWIAAEYNNQGSPSTFYSLSTENIAITPASVSLYASQSQAFTASVPNSCSSSVTWTMNPAGVGTLTADGVYTAPASVAAQQTVTITATSPSNPAESASATVILMPALTLSVTPSSVTLYDGGQTQQFTASLQNALNSGLTWTVSPAGVGTVDVTGLYTAPQSISAQQTVTVTAASQQDPTKSASATVTLIPATLPPPLCGSGPYSYARSIVIDHTQVPNTDQTSFPFLFNSTDPNLAAVAFGGHVANFNGYDIIFAADPSGETKLDFEIEKYNPTTGQLIAWVRIPTLSHASDTVIYILYGNTSVTTSQQNPTGVWDSNYLGVWHVPNGTLLSLADSTSNGNNATDNGALATAGQIDGGMMTDGTTFARIGAPADLANLAHGSATFSAWVNPASTPSGMILGKGGFSEGGWTLGLYDGTFQLLVYDDNGGDPQSTIPVGTGWSYVTATIAQSSSDPTQSQISLYVNGVPAGTNTVSITNPIDDTPAAADLANNDYGDFNDKVVSPLNGAEDEFRISKTARSADWIATEYNNQSSPSTFYSFFPEGFQGVAPAAATVYPSGSRQFEVISYCSSPSVTWSLSNGAGSINATGLYSAPTSIGSQQTATVTATNQTDGSTVGSAVVTLMPPISVSLSPATATITTFYGTIQFTATVLNATNPAVTWSTSSGAGYITQTGLFTALYFPLPQTVTVTVTSQQDPTKSASATVTLLPPTTLTLEPTQATLSAGQGEQFSSCLAIYEQPTNCTTAIAWSISPSGVGTISPSGLYTAPAAVPSEQTVVVTAADANFPAISQSATITLIPPLTVLPATATLYGGQTKQYSATVGSGINPTVTWSVSPGGAGTISPSGLYQAPAIVSSQQTVTITATSPIIPGLSASATLVLLPTQCAAKAYSYMRPIVIDHTRVPSTDQKNFPFLFSVTDPAFASTANGGHIESSNGYDIVFSSDPAGVNALDYELEKYDPVAGQIIAWIRIPSLSHSEDTTLYMFYGNPSISASQQNAPSVWTNNYLGVWHLDNGTVLSANDSTANGYWGTVFSASATTGVLDGAASFTGSNPSSHIDIGNMGAFPPQGTIEFWMNPSSLSSYPNAFTTNYGGQNNAIRFEEDSSGDFSVDIGSGSFNGYSFVVGSMKPSTWYDVALTWNAAISNATGFLNGGQVFNAATSNLWPSNFPNVAIGGGYDSTRDWIGSIDEVRVSAVQRSADWLSAEYNNETSPSTFFTIYPENSSTIVPTAVNLYASQAQQFLPPNGSSCTTPAAVWSMPAGSPGTLSATGFYAAPSSIGSNQTVTVTATTLGDQSQSFNATVNLMPPVGIGVSPAAATLSAGQTQQFTATVTNAVNTTAVWTVSPAGAGSVSSAGLYTAPSSISTQQTVYITATSQVDPSQSATAVVTLLPASSAPQVGVSVAPLNPTLYGGQTQQFIATASNTTNTQVTWGVTPAGAGSISSSGLYSAPATISAQQTVTVTATSEADPTVSGTTTINLSPSCASSGYSFVRSIVIDHTRVPNTDQISFPFLFSLTDSALRSAANGGHVTSSNGYDIIFSSDPGGQNRLDYELEKYDPVQGLVVAWIRIPTLSHLSDTTVYLFYGNQNVTSSQANPTGVWSNGYSGVWHLISGGNSSSADSTNNQNVATNVNTTSAVGPIGGLATGLNGSTSYVNVPGGGGLNGASQGTISMWVQWTGSSQSEGAGAFYGAIVGRQSDNNFSNDIVGINGPDSATAKLQWLGENGSQFLTGFTPVSNSWDYVSVAFGATGQVIYLNGSPEASTSGTITLNNDSSIPLTFGAWIGDGNSYMSGAIEEAHVSSVARSADWIATEYNNENSPSTFYSISSEGAELVIPSAVVLYAGQAEQFVATSQCSSSVTWSMPSGSPGTLSASGLYTAPGTIPAQQTVTITATNESGASSTAVVSLMPPVSVGMTPSTAALTENQNQQFTAVVANTSDPEVTWSISPSGAGTIDASGLYSAPSSITTQQTVTVVAISQADPSKSAFATITLSPTQAASNDYGYESTIVIDHTKVSNSDQTNFPFLFKTTDPSLAYVGNGGHVTNPSGYDIFFSTDPSGQTKLDHEIEEYNPATGQLIAWVRIPNLSHSADTVLYMFYGNSNISTPQANPTGVWDSNYEGVYHLASLQAGNTSDSTANANTATVTAAVGAQGEIDGAAGFNGTSSYLQIPSVDFPNYPTGEYQNLGIEQSNTTTPFTATFGIWFKTTSAGGILTQVPSTAETCIFGIICFTNPVTPGYVDPPGWAPLMYIDDNGNLEGGDVFSARAYNDNVWHFGVVTYQTDGTETLYVDGKAAGTATVNPAGYSSTYSYFVGTAYTLLDPLGDWNWLYFNGSLDEMRVSNIARSGDWIQTEYNNQGSPSTFYQYYPFGTCQVAPSSVSLYAAQAEQFVVTAGCTSSPNWSMTSGGPGTLSSGGLYTAPDTVSTQQTVAVTATNSSGSTIGSGTVTLLPPPAPITLSASSAGPYVVGSSQTFQAVLKDEGGAPEAGVVVTFNVSGANSTIGSVTTDQTGTATFSYIGTNSGNDTLQANAVADGNTIASNSVSTSWIEPAQTIGASATLEAQPTPESVVSSVHSRMGTGMLLNRSQLARPLANSSCPREQHSFSSESTTNTLRTTPALGLSSM